MGMHVGNHGTNLELGELENYKLCVLRPYFRKRKLFWLVDYLSFVREQERGFCWKANLC